MTGVIYQRQGERLIEMREQPYDTEALLQDLLSSHPALLAGEQIDQAAPRRWLLVQAEIGVPDRLDGTGRWALDHLFLDQDARPTLVEVKRSTDTRIRREVIGQMLDYAAHATAYWTADRLRLSFEQRCARQNSDPEEAVRALWGDDVDAFWARAVENLHDGRLRLLFVADVLPAELRRVIEFLNGAFTDIEVLGVEVKQYTGDGAQALVPRVIGQTVRAQDRKHPAARTPGEVWTAERFAEDVRARGLPGSVAILDQLLSFAAAHGLRVWWGKGVRNGSVMLATPQAKSAQLYFYSDGDLILNGSEIPKHAPFDQPGAYAALEQQLGHLTGPGSPPTSRISVRALPDHIQAPLGAVLKRLFGHHEQSGGES